LSRALLEMSDGLAMFDADGRLVFCNDRYRSSFPLTGAMRQPGVHIRDILQEVLRTGEQMGLPAQNSAAWVQSVVAALKVGGEEEVALYNGQWLHIRTRPASDGTSLVVVSDATTMKTAEGALRSLTSELQQLATTDGLTGLMNRRAFDQAFVTELARTARDATPLALLMIDVDSFKAYNDQYGHPAGDECLRAVGLALKQVIKRPADIVARYGGEEFVVLLPNTDEDGAYVIAEAFRKALRGLGIPHEASPKRVVTASIGLCVATGHGERDIDLLARADKALYDAKAAGRDRVTGWRLRGNLGTSRRA
jgi:diguanylate cyclase (GGDEF)-like protein